MKTRHFPVRATLFLPLTRRFVSNVMLAGIKFCVATLLLLLSSTSLLPADTSEASLEERVKAAYLYKFAGYVEWPEWRFPQPNSPFTIGVIGSPAIAYELSASLEGQTINNHPVKILTPGENDTLDNIHILFISSSMQGQLDDILELTRDYPILTVTESERDMPEGSIINFMLVERYVRFSISLPTAQQAGLHMSSRLLSVAQQVYGKEAQ